MQQLQQPGDVVYLQVGGKFLQILFTSFLFARRVISGIGEVISLHGINAIQFYTVDLIKIRLRKSGSSFRTNHECKLQAGSSTATKNGRWWVPEICLLTFGVSRFTTRTL